MTTDDETAGRGRAKYQVMAVHCESCARGWHEAGGVKVPVSAAVVARGECDAQRVGTDQAPERAAQDVAPKVHRFVWRRDHGKCVVPWCRTSRHLELHHIVPRAEGGSHEAENLCLLCNGHHDRLHEGTLKICGRAPALVMEDPQRPTPHVGHDGEAAPLAAVEQVPTPHVGHDGEATPRSVRSKYDWVVMKTEAATALSQAGFTKSEARALVDRAGSDLPRDASLEQLVRAALKGSMERTFDRVMPIKRHRIASSSR